MCGELGIDAAGIVVEYPSPVPWNVDRVAGRRLVAEAPQGLQVVMVTSGTPRDIAELASYVQPHMVQVHGEESLTDVAEIVERLRPLGIGVFRALRIVPETKQAAGEITDPRDAARALAATGVKGIVVDSKVPRRPGGTGVAVDVPIVAAGGLNAGNVGEVIRRAQPWGVDVLTGVEAAPGEKDVRRMQEFVAAVRAAAG
jgi:phosphoribosylanthranilate isomerase